MSDASPGYEYWNSSTKEWDNWRKVNLASTSDDGIADCYTHARALDTKKKSGNVGLLICGSAQTAYGLSG